LLPDVWSELPEHATPALLGQEIEIVQGDADHST
jgi:hypothetical protein